MKPTHSILSYLKTLLVIASSLSLLVACAAPRTTVQTDGQNGSILLKVTPSSASVDVDGQVMGKAREFNGSSAVLKVTPGKHLITLKAEGFEDFATQVYISDTQETVEVSLKKVP